jgi:hypothetical protein
MIDCQVRLSRLKPGQRIRNLHTHWTGRVYARRSDPRKAADVGVGLIPIRTRNRQGDLVRTRWSVRHCMVIVRVK